MSSALAIVRFAQQYSVYSAYVIHGVGLLGNALSILVFTHLRLFRRDRFTWYLIAETTCNFVNELLTVLASLATVIYGDSVIAFSINWCRARFFIFQVSGLGTVSMICLAAIDQYCSTSYRLDVRQLYTDRLAQCLIIGCFCFWTLHSCVFNIFLGIHPLVGCAIVNPVWVQYSTYFFYPVLAGLLPNAIASTFSLLAFRNVRRIVRRQVPIERRRFDQQITAMILVRVVLFVVCTLPYSCYRVYAINVKVDANDQLRAAIERLVQVTMVSFNNLNYAVSFYVFLVVSSRFRRQAKQVLLRKCWRRLKRCCSCATNEVCPENTVMSDENADL